MSFSTIFDNPRSLRNPLVIEYYFRGEKIEDPATFFELNEELFELVFPSREETLLMIDKYIYYSETHKLVISEFGFHLVHL